jgi:hypothetical protein
MTSRRQLLEELRGKLQELEASFRPATGRAQEALPTGVGPLNPLLAGGGFRDGTIVEWLTAEEGSGAGLLAFRSVVPWLDAGQTCVVIEKGVGSLLETSARRHTQKAPDPFFEFEFYPAFLASLGIDLEQLLIVRPSAKDVWWALEQSLLCRGVAVTVGWLDRVPERILRRLQLAAETGGGIGIFFRPAQVRTEPAWCHVRLLVRAMSSIADVRLQIADFPKQSAIPRRARIEVLYCKGGKSDGVVEVDIHEETGDVYLAAPLAPARDARQAT